MLAARERVEKFELFHTSKSKCPECHMCDTVRKIAVVLSALSLLGVLASGNAFAATKELGAQAGGPARVVACGWSTNSDARASHLEISFTNTSSVTLKAVRARFDFYDAFGEEIGTLSFDQNGTFSPGIRIDQGGLYGGWLVGDLRMPWRVNTARLVCSIEKTLDVNGNLWLNKTLPSPAPSPSSI